MSSNSWAGWALLLVFCVTVLPQEKARGRLHRSEEIPTDLADFVVYAEPSIVDALRKRPFSKRDPIVEYFFHTLPGITQSVYEENLAAMQQYFARSQSEKERKLFRLAELAGVDLVPESLREGYEDRLETLETILGWMRRQKPIQLEQLTIWKEADLRYRLARLPVENIRINPQSQELESRLRFNWQMIYLERKRAMDLRLEFEMGIHLQKQSGFYDPKGFLHWSELNARNLQVFKVTYPIIITEALRNNTEAEMPAFLEAYRTTMNSFYQILQEFFFSDLADIHTLYILTRGRIFAEEWRQYNNTALLRGLAAYLVFQTMEEQIGRPKILEILENDWTTWHLRKIGHGFDALTWDGEPAPYFKYGDYKKKPSMRNIYWSTQFVRHLIEQYGPSFIEDACAALKNRRMESEESLFRDITGDDLSEVLQAFVDKHS